MHCSAVAICATKLARVHTRLIIRQPSMLKRPFEEASFLSKMKMFTITKSLRFADTVIVSSTVMLKEFIHETGICHNKVQIVYNPVPIELIKMKSLEPIEHPWFSENNFPILLAAGRLVEVKDYPTLLKAVAIVKETTPIRLVILGEGKLRSELELLIKKLGLSDTVQMLGYVSNPYKYMRNSKAFILSSVREGFPNSMVEAMACGNAIISTDCGGAAEILENGKWGELVPVRNPEKMAIAIKKVLDDRNLPFTHNRALDFSVDKVLADYYSVLNLE